MMMKERAHVFITGRVQGVFFRATTRDEAKKNRVTDWVRNLADGRVEAVFEGNKQDVENMLEFCHKGPSMAHVTDMEIKREKFEGEFNDFKVKR